MQARYARNATKGGAASRLTISLPAVGLQLHRTDGNGLVEKLDRGRGLDVRLLRGHDGLGP